MLLSGGIDSAASLRLAMKTFSPRALTFEYFGIAKKELESAKAIGAWAKVKEHRIVGLPDLKEAADIPGARFGDLPPTYVPMRNSIFYSFASSYAEETRASAIVGGHNLDDAVVFFDVSASFFRSLERAFRAGSPILRKLRLRIIRPLQGLRKDQVVKMASSLGVPLELTWSCHRDGESHCWNCPGCASRRASFLRAGISDPLW